MFHNSKGNQVNKFERAILAPLVASGILLALMSPVAHAIDRIVNSSDNITDVTCNISGRAPGTDNATNVNLGIMTPTHFITVGANSTFQKLDLIPSGAGCTNDEKVSIVFDTVINVDRISGNLMLVGPSGARSMQIRIFNNSVANTTKVPPGLVGAAPQKATIDENMAILKYRASYVPTERTVITGTGLSHIRYLLTYE